MRFIHIISHALRPRNARKFADDKKAAAAAAVAAAAAAAAEAAAAAAERKRADDKRAADELVAQNEALLVNLMTGVAKDLDQVSGERLVLLMCCCWGCCAAALFLVLLHLNPHARCSAVSKRWLLLQVSGLACWSSRWRCCRRNTPTCCRT